MIRFSWLLVLISAASAQSWKCDAPEAKVYSKGLIAVRCSQGWPAGTAKATVTALPEGIPVEQNIAVERLAGNQPSHIKLLPIHLRHDLSPNSNYEITIASGADKTVVSLTLDKAVLVNQPGFANRGKIFLVQSAARLTKPAGPVFLTEVRQPALYDTHTGKPLPEVIVRHPATVEVRDSVPSDDPVDIDFALAGLAIVTTTDATWIRGKQVTLRIDGIRDIFGREVPTTSKVKLDPAPRGKEDANVYLMLSHTAAKLSKPSFALDAKYSSPFARRGQWYSSPDLEADVGNDQAEARNTIRGGIRFDRTFVAPVSRRPATCESTAKTHRPSRLEAHTLSPAILYETDRDGTKRNLLPSIDWQPVFSGLHNSIEEQTLRWAAETCKDPEKIVPPRFGWGMDARLGAEGGASLADQTVANLDGSQRLTARKYPIFRPRPVVVGFFETRWFSVVDSVTLRYLFTTEHIIDTTAFTLNEVSGFQPYNNLALYFPLGRAKNMAIVMQYEWGEKPPVYRHLNTVSTGITFKY